jgi:ferredoxin
MIVFSEGGVANRIKIVIDPARCDGFGNCVMAAPGIFELSEEGKATLPAGSLPIDIGKRDLVARAVYNCPVSAISFEEE